MYMTLGKNMRAKNKVFTIPTLDFVINKQMIGYISPHINTLKSDFYVIQCILDHNNIL